jgi:ubiquinone/menaquinone biosynthesis C-methylase UbiE
LDDLQLLIDLHRDGDRQGPGSEATTRRAIELSGLQTGSALKIADIGCGTGASTYVLARELDAQITAVDFLPAFLEELERNAQQIGVSDRITTLSASMDALSFDDNSLDAIWSEGAIYNIGFENGVRSWRRYLKPGGVLAVSELTWTTAVRPDALDAHWKDAYPEVDTASAKLAVLEQCGYSPIGYFTLPESCWLENYYHPMQNRFSKFLEMHEQSEPARAIVEAEKVEIALYEKYKTYFNYGFYLARRTND